MQPNHVIHRDWLRYMNGKTPEDQWRILCTIKALFAKTRPRTRFCFFCGWNRTHDFR